MDIKYTITFHNEWHCGSGLAAGADVDALTIKDRDRLPFVPGKTIKGLVREALQDLYGFQGRDTGELVTLLGLENDNPDDRGPADDWHASQMHQGCAYFTDATLPDAVAGAIVSHGAAQLLYRSIASTAIGPDDVALEHTLRKVQVTAPCVLEGEIHNVPDNMCDQVCRALRYIKRLGHNRSRGYGRCDIAPVQKGGAQP